MLLEIARYVLILYQYSPLPPSSEPSSHKAFTMVIACGPYTSDSNLDYRQFNTLMEKVMQTQPSVLLLVRFACQFPYSALNNILAARPIR